MSSRSSTSSSATVLSSRRTLFSSLTVDATLFTLPSLANFLIFFSIFLDPDSNNAIILTHLLRYNYKNVS